MNMDEFHEMGKTIEQDGVKYVAFLQADWERLDKRLMKFLTMKDILTRLAWPRRGTNEEGRDIYDFAKEIQDKFTLEELEQL